MGQIVVKVTPEGANVNIVVATPLPGGAFLVLEDVTEPTVSLVPELLNILDNVNPQS